VIDFLIESINKIPEGEHYGIIVQQQIKTGRIRGSRKQDFMEKLFSKDTTFGHWFFCTILSFKVYLTSLYQREKAFKDNHRIIEKTEVFYGNNKYSSIH
jgi:hypothetical protein